MERLIVFWANERDDANLAILKAAGLLIDAAIRAALASLAAEYTPVAWALATGNADINFQQPLSQRAWRGSTTVVPVWP